MVSCKQGEKKVTFFVEGEKYLLTRGCLISVRQLFPILSFVNAPMLFPGYCPFLRMRVKALWIASSELPIILNLLQYFFHSLQINPFLRFNADACFNHWVAPGQEFCELMYFIA